MIEYNYGTYGTTATSPVQAKCNDSLQDSAAMPSNDDIDVQSTVNLDILLQVFADIHHLTLS